MKKNTLLIILASINLLLYAQEGGYKLLLNEFFINEINDSGATRAAISIEKDGKVIYNFNYCKDGTDDNANYLIGSVSKSLTAIGIMMLVDKSLINLDDYVSKYLSFFKMKDDRYGLITIRQLLSHSSGISRDLGVSYLGLQKKQSISDLVLLLHDKELKYEPGTQFEYSNYNYVLLGAIIENVSGESYEDYMKKNVFSVLEMNSTAAGMQKSLYNGLVSGRNGFFGFSIDSYLNYPEGAIPEGYISSTIGDMEKYLYFLTNKGISINGERALTERSFNEMFTRQSPRYVYGFGWFIGDKYFNHSGKTPGYSTIVFSSTEKHSLSWVILLNISDNLHDEILPSIEDRLQAGIYQAVFNSKIPNIGNSKYLEYRIGVIAISCICILLTILVGIVVLHKKKLKILLASIVSKVILILFIVFLLPTIIGNNELVNIFV